MKDAATLSRDLSANDINLQHEEEEGEEEGEEEEEEETVREENQSTAQLESSGLFPVIFQLEGRRMSFASCNLLSL